MQQVTSRKWAVVTVPLALIALATPAAAAGNSGPIEPITPITSDITPIQPIAPITESTPSRAPLTVPAPRPPAAPKAPELPSMAGNASAVKGRIDAIAATVARIGSFSASGGTLGGSDGAPLSASSSQDVLNALKDGRQLMSGQVTPGQVEVGPDGCPTSAPDGTLRGGSDQIGVAQLCADSVAQAATPEAAKAVAYAFTQLGAPYACGGVGRLEPYRFDCSSLVTRAYSEGAGLNTASATYAPSTRELMPWGGGTLASWADEVAPENVRPGDLLVYRTCDGDKCSYQHVAMALADGYMLHTNRCGDVAHVTSSWGTGPEHNFAVARRVNPEKAR